MSGHRNKQKFLLVSCGIINLQKNKRFVFRTKVRASFLVKMSKDYYMMNYIKLKVVTSTEHILRLEQK